MNYQGLPGYRHDSEERSGVLLVNLGTPAAPTTAAVASYLAEFLADPRVVELPRLLWWPLLYGVIVPLRSARSAHAYRQVWSELGSPLRWHSEQLAKALQDRLRDRGRRVEVRLAMRYGQPAVAKVIDDWCRQGLRRLLVLPLYPQFSATTTASVFDAVQSYLGRCRWPPELRLINDYYQQPGWATAVANSIRAYWRLHGAGERLLFSFHGLPQRYLRAGDPYFCQCHASARMIAGQLQLPEERWELAFQSRVGREPWLQPYTEARLQGLAGAGHRRVDVVCPGFAVDCLETLEEIAQRGRDSFLAAGGEQLRYLPALNASAEHAELLADLVDRHGAGWQGFDPTQAVIDSAGRERRRLAYQGPQA